MPERLHGGTQNPADSRRVVFVARRPGTAAFEVQLDERRIVRTIQAAPGRHFYGHAEHTADGAALLTSENAYADGSGKIVVRDTADYSILAEYESGGIGPHDLRLLSDGVTLAVANGGIRTHPAKHRQKLNRATMASSLTYIDIRTGKVISDYRLPNSKLSIRHLRVALNDDVLMSLQYEGDPTDCVPLLAIHTGASAPTTFATPLDVASAMRGYSSEAAFDAREAYVYLALPRANMLVRYERSSGRFAGSVGLEQVTSLVADTTMGESGILVASKTLGVGGPVERTATSLAYRLDDHFLLTT